MSKQDLAGPSVREIPQGDNMERLVCPDCGFIAYENPKVVVGAVAVWDEKILLCRRAINPRIGFWTLPCGYMEEKETSLEGAQREAWEEAFAKFEPRGILAVYSIPRISQVQIFYLADLISPEVAAGPESQEVALFDWDDIPWGDLAFPSVKWALDHYKEAKNETVIQTRSNPPGELGQMSD
ncbi:MAG: NUDIX hydrolase [Rhodospirillaceae bacterium]|nr:NUDIX hydrolase [Rhodospirillaceae bacterium]|tara:strand:- start:20350 stop:20895 length:546 start_codon:yes stop_codon:yes gene_type:complete